MKYTALIPLILVVTGCNYTQDDLAHELARSVVRMHTPAGAPLGTGSLVFTPSDKLVILTNWHVCSYTGGVVNKAYFKVFPELLEQGTIISSDMTVDLCAIAVPSDLAEIRPGLTLGEAPKLFEPVVMVGYPLDKPLTPSFGYLVGREKEFIAMGPGPCLPGQESRPGFFGITCGVIYDIYQTNVITYPGNSGSPVVDLHGELIGVINSGDSRTNWGGVIPLDSVRKFLEAL